MYHTLTKNQRRLLKYLSGHKSFVRGIDIASHLGISDRTVRNVVTQLDETLKGYQARILAIRGKGYMLEVKSLSSLHGLIYADESISTQEDRVRYITLKLIQSNEPIALGVMQDEIFVSRTTLENDLHNLKRRFSEDVPFIKLNRSGNCIFFEDNEQKKRLVLRNLFASDWDYNSDDGLWERNTILDPQAFDIISIAVKQTLYNCRIKLNDNGLVNLVFGIAISHYRISSGNVLKEAKEYNTEEKVANAVNQLCDVLEKDLQINFAQAERAWIEEELSQRMIYGMSGLPERALIRKTDTRLKKIVHSGLKVVRDTFGLELEKDTMLVDQLIMAFQSFFNRPVFLKAPASQISTVLKNIFPFIHEMTTVFYDLYFEMFEKALCEDELSEIGGYLFASIERIAEKKFANGVKAVLATDLGYGGAMFLLARLCTVFAGQIDFVGHYSIYEKQSINDTGCKLILSTVNINLLKDEGNTVLHISPELGQEELVNIWDYLQNYRKNMFFSPLGHPFSQLFSEDLFIKDLDCETWEEAVILLTETMKKNAIVSETFADAVIRREKIASNAYEQGFAIPRAVSSLGSRTVCAVGILKKPILWGQEYISILFIPVVQEGEEPKIVNILHYLLEHLQKKKVKQLMQTSNFDEFIQMLTNESEQKTIC